MSEGPRTPTRSEINTFKVLSNLDFTDLRKPEPLKWSPDDPPMPEEAKLPTPKVTPKVTPKATPTGTPLIVSHKMITPVPSLPITPQSSTPPSPVLRPMTPIPETKEHVEAKKMSEIDITLEKEALLYELEIMEKQGSIKLHRQLTISDDLDTIQYQYDRANMIISTQQTVEWAKTGIRMGSGLIETFAKKFGVSMIDGFSNNLCKDMNKFNKPLTKMYRKYWRRGSSSPETELAMIVFGALAMTVLANRGLGKSENKEPAKETAKEVPAKEPIKETAREPVKVPEWARNALKTPEVKVIDKSDPPVHFAAEVIKKPEEEPVIPQRMPVVPVPAVSAPEEPRETVKKLTLTSPRSSRRKREVQEELNLDD
jgi:hypothetical protein